VSNSKPSNGKPKTNGNGAHETTAAAVSKALANKFGLPKMPTTLKAIEAGIESECLVSHCTELEAAEIIAENTDQSTFRTKPPHFYFEDADWRNNKNYRPKAISKQ